MPGTRLVPLRLPRAAQISGPCYTSRYKTRRPAPWIEAMWPARWPPRRKTSGRSSRARFMTRCVPALCSHAADAWWPAVIWLRRNRTWLQAGNCWSHDLTVPSWRACREPSHDGGKRPPGCVRAKAMAVAQSPLGDRPSKNAGKSPRCPKWRRRRRSMRWRAL